MVGTSLLNELSVSSQHGIKGGQAKWTYTIECVLFINRYPRTARINSHRDQFLLKIRYLCSKYSCSRAKNARMNVSPGSIACLAWDDVSLRWSWWFPEWFVNKARAIGFFSLIMTMVMAVGLSPCIRIEIILGIMASSERHWEQGCRGSQHHQSVFPSTSVRLTTKWNMLALKGCGPNKQWIISGFIIGPKVAAILTTDKTRLSRDASHDGHLWLTCSI